MIHKLRQALLVAILMPAGLTIAADGRHSMWKYPPDLPGATVHTFKKVGQTELKAWVFRPDGIKPTERRPAVVFFFGGGWNGGTPGQFYQQCRYLASRGIVAITADYRVRRRHNVLAPICLADTKSAIRWVRANGAKLGVDEDRIVAAGGSAGGHLAACTGVIDGFDDQADDLTISAVPNAMARRDHLDSLLQMLKSRWHGRGAGTPISKNVALNDVAESVSATAAAFAAMEKLYTDNNLDAADWNSRKRVLERSLLRPLRTYRTQLLAQQPKPGPKPATGNQSNAN